MLNLILNIIELDFQKAVEIAIKSNIQILQSEKSLELSSFDYIKSRSNILPKVSINAIYTYTANPAVIKFGTPTRYIGYQDPQHPGQFIIYPDPNSIVYSELPFRPAHTFNAQFTLQQNIFNWFRDINAIRLSQEQIEIQKLNVQINKFKIEYQVKSFYIDLLFFKETFKLQEKTINDLEEIYKSTKLRYEKGLSSNLELNQAEVNYENAKISYENAKRTYEELLNNLKMILNLPKDEEIVIKDSLEGLNISQIEVNENNLNNRLDIISYEKQLRALNLLSNVQNSLNKPNLIAQVQFLGSRPAPNLEDKFGGTWTFSIIFAWNVFDGFSTSADVNKTIIQDEQINLLKNFAILNANIQLKNALSSIERNKQNLESAKRNAKLSEALLNSSKEQYEKGYISNLQFNDIQRTYIASQINYKQALRDYYKSLIDLEAVLKGGK
ncbi:MAG: TolC family protein [Candidatus Hydrothermia bacterium]|nr:TolC family protein [Candidatus Hydrothermia bacterium]